MLSSSHLKADADKCPRGSGLLPGPLLPVDTFLWEVPSQAHTPSRVPMFSSGLSQMSPGWLGLRDILRLSRGRWGRGPAPRWVTAGPTGHGTLYSPPVLPPLLAQGSLGSAGQFWVCVCVCAHTRVGRGGRDRGPDGSTAVSLVRGQDLLRGSCPRLGPPYCGTPGFQVRRQRDRARQPCITRVCTSPVAQWLGLHTPSQEFDPWSGN